MRVIFLLAAVILAVDGNAAPTQEKAAQHLLMHSAGRLLVQVDVQSERACVDFLGRMKKEFSGQMSAECGARTAEEKFVAHAILRMAETQRNSDAYFVSQDSCEGFTRGITRSSLAVLVEPCRPLMTSPKDASVAQQVVPDWHRVTDFVEIGLQSGWEIASQERILEFEKERAKAISQAGLEKKVSPSKVVTFQAVKTKGPDSVTLGITVLPGEASQAEVNGLSEERVLQIGSVFAQQFHTAVSSLGGRESRFSRPVLQQVGNMTAITYSTSFVAPDGFERKGVKYHVYMRNATVILSVTSASSIQKSLADEADAAIQLVRLTER
jgi:hypothetical protein